MTSEMHVAWLLLKQHNHTKMLEDDIVNYQLYNPESFKKSKIEHFQLENLFFPGKQD